MSSTPDRFVSSHKPTKRSTAYAAAKLSPPPNLSRSTVDEILDYIVHLPIDAKTHRLGIGRGALGAILFADCCTCERSAVQLLILIVNSIGDYQRRNESTRQWTIENGVGIGSLIISAFLCWINPFAGGGDKRKRRPKGVANTKIDDKKVTIQSSVPIRLSVDERIAVAALMQTMRLPSREKLWQFAIRMLSLKNADTIDAFVGSIRRHLADGSASYELCAQCINDRILRTYFAPDDILMHTLLLGTLSAANIEAYASDRNREFRQRCREVLNEAESIDSPAAWQRAVRMYAHREPGSAGMLVYHEYMNNIRALLRELRAEPPDDDRVHVGWAFAALKRAGKRFYVEKWYSYDQLHELIWTVLAQRPELKGRVMKTIERDFNDPDEAAHWSKFNANTAKAKDIPLLDSPDHILPLADDQTQYLSLPEHLVDTVLFVNTPAQLRIVDETIEKLLMAPKTLVVGLDAEWSPYTGFSKASILQLATTERIFIIDLEMNRESLIAFLSRLFSNQDIVKIGFEFHEDLVQLRAAVPRCPALYAPKGLACIQRLVDILSNIGRAPDNLLKSTADDTISSMNDDDDIDQSGEIDDDDETKPSTQTKPEQQRGLSALCVKLLGQPVDKREQCSVWDRRPLRVSQMRYAALDAYCMLMLFDKCRVWADALDKNVYELAMQSPNPATSLPLFYDE